MIAEPKPFDEGILTEIKQRVGFDDDEWERVMTAPLSHYTQHKTYKQTFERLRPLFYSLYKLGYVTRSFYMKYCVFRETAAMPSRPSVFPTSSRPTGSSAAA